MNNINKYILFIAYFIVAPEFIKGNGTNYHVFTNQIFTSICHHKMTLKEGEKLAKVGRKFETRKELEQYMDSMDASLCANCSRDYVHSDRT